MNVYEIPGLRFSMPAGAAVERQRFVSVNSTGKGITATASTQIIGASMNKCEAADEVLEIADGIVMVTAAAAITAGTAVYSDANGKVASSGTVVAGIAITDAEAAGDIIAVKIN